MTDRPYIYTTEKDLLNAEKRLYEDIDGLKQKLGEVQSELYNRSIENSRKRTA